MAHLCHGLYRSGHGEYAFVDAGNNLADASLDSGLVAKIGDVFAGLADNHTGILGAHERSERQDVVAGRRW